MVRAFFSDLTEEDTKSDQDGLQGKYFIVSWENLMSLLNVCPACGGNILPNNILTSNKGHYKTVDNYQWHQK